MVAHRRGAPRHGRVVFVASGEDTGYCDPMKGGPFPSMRVWQCAVAGIALSPIPAYADRETLGIGGGAPVHVLVLLAIAAIVALVLLTRWQPRKRGRKRGSIGSPRSAKKNRRRG